MSAVFLNALRVNKAEIDHLQARIRDLKIADEISYNRYNSHLGFLEFQEENELVTLADYQELNVAIEEAGQIRERLWDAYQRLEVLVERTEEIATEMRLLVSGMALRDEERAEEM